MSCTCKSRDGKLIINLRCPLHGAGTEAWRRFVKRDTILRQRRN